MHKERIQGGHVHDVFPYDPARRFSRRRAGAPLPAHPLDERASELTAD